MFQPQFGALALALLVAGAPMALAQTAPNAVITVSGTVTHAAPAVATGTEVGHDSNAILEALSAQAGIPFIPKKTATLAVDASATVPEPRLCVRAGVGLSAAVMSSGMTVEHGLIGCPTHTGGLPVIVTQDPALTPPPTSRTGEYNLDLTLRYRLLQLKHMQLVASATEQGVGYSLSSPVSGNNLLVAMSLVF